MQSDNYIRSVRDQYENYPYPSRDPQEEKTLLKTTLLERLEFLNHYCFGGRRDFSKKFRMLSAGGGTGDSVIYVAEQLHGTNADIVYLDMSEASMDVAKERAKVRGLDNIKWVHGSILDLPKLELGKFDYINCTGVLHHMEDPSAGLDALASSLKEDGSIGLMLYGKYGRDTIYQMQELMRYINNGEDNLQTQVDNCRSILNNLPKSNHLHNSITSRRKDLTHDIGIYDLFLHSQDRAYSVPQLYEFVGKSNLKINNMVSFGGFEGGNLYSPEIYINNPSILQKVKSYNLPDQQAVAELLNGDISKHSFLVSRKQRLVPRLDDFDNAIYFSWVLDQNFNAETMCNAVKGLGHNAEVKVDIGAFNVHFRFINTPNTYNILKNIANNHTIGQIYEDIKKRNSGLSKEIFLQELEQLFSVFNTHGFMFIRHKSVACYKSVAQMQERVKCLYEDAVDA